MTITLTTIGSRNVTIDVAPAALPDAGPGGVGIEIGLYERPLILTLRRDEAVQLRWDLERVLLAG